MMVDKKNFPHFRDSQRPFLSKQTPILKQLFLSTGKREGSIIKATEEFERSEPQILMKSEFCSPVIRKT